MKNEINKSLIKKDSSFIQKVGHQIALTNKLITSFNEKSAKEYFDKGNQCYSNNNFQEAILNYTNAIEIERTYKTDFSDIKFKSFENRAKAKIAIKDIKSGEIDKKLAWIESLKSGGHNFRGFSEIILEP